MPFDIKTTPLVSLGPRWVGHQHFFPTEPLLEQLQALGVHVITTLRRPAGVLVSLLHWMKSPAATKCTPDDPMRLLQQDGPAPGQWTLHYVRSYFASLVACSATWLPYRRLVVRYLDLLAKPVAELTRLTNAVVTATPKDVQNAIAMCELSMLRRRFPDMAYHFRRGLSQHKNLDQRLPEEIIQALADESPYPSLNATLGYSFSNPPKIELFDYRTLNPFHGREKFSNGIAVVHPIPEIYLKHIPDARIRWPDPVDAGPDSFFAHLCENIDDHKPALPRLAAYIHMRRDDLRRAFPDYLSSNRLDYTQWLITRGMGEYTLSQIFFDTTFRSLASDQPAFRLLHPPGMPANTIEIQITSSDGNAIPRHDSGAWAVVSVGFTPTADLRHPILTLSFTDHRGQEFFSTSIRADDAVESPPAAGTKRRIAVLLQLNLSIGHYHCSVKAQEPGGPSPTATLAAGGVPLEVTAPTGTAWTGVAYCHPKILETG